MTKLRLYLDVDGVINADSPQAAWGERAPKTGNAVADGYSYRIAWSGSLIDALKHFVQEYDVELVWATTWQEDAPGALADLIGFGADARVLRPLSGRVDFPSIHWKREAIIDEQLVDPSPFIWIDDEIFTTEISDATALGGLPIGPNPNRGITPDNIRVMKGYAESHEIPDPEQLA